MDYRKMGNFANKVIAAFFVGVVLLLACPYFALGTDWIIGTDASVDISSTTYNYDGLTISGSGALPSAVITGDKFSFGAAGNVLTITDNGNDNTGNVMSLDSITGRGTLIFDLQNSSTTLTISNNIGATNNRVSKIEILEGDGQLTVSNLFAGTLINNGDLTINGTGTSRVGELGGSGAIKGTGNLTIENTAPEGFSGNISTSGNLTINQGFFGGNITTTGSGNFTADLKGDLTIEGILTVAGDATFKGDGRAELGTVNVAGSTTITDNATAALDIANSTFAASGINASNGMLEVYGDDVANYGTDVTFIGTPDNFKNLSIFTDWKLDTSSGTIVCGGRLPQAYMSDGYLAALTMHHRYTAWNMTRDRLISGNDHDGYGKTAWFNYVGRSNAYLSSFNNRNWKTFTHGGQVGVDLFKTPRFQSGVLFGYEGSQSKNDGDQLETSDLYFGLYGAYIFQGGADARIVFAQGWQIHDLDRVGNGVVLYTSSFDGWTSEANFELGKRVSLGGGCSLRPVVAFDLFNNNLKGVQEAGNGDEKITYSKTSLTQAFFRTGTDIRHRAKDYTFNSGIYYAYDMHGAELRTMATSVKNPTLSAPLAGTKWGRSLLMFNLGVEGEITTNFSLFCGYTGEYVMDSAKDALHSIASVGFFGKW